eukprot:scaffold121216_cov19-Tisochrysis_lutea.AAC.3
MAQTHRQLQRMGPPTHLPLQAHGPPHSSCTYAICHAARLSTSQRLSGICTSSERVFPINNQILKFMFCFLNSTRRSASVAPAHQARESNTKEIMKARESNDCRASAKSTDEVNKAQNIERRRQAGETWPCWTACT